MDFSVVQQDLEEVPNGEVYFIFMEDDNEKCKIGKSDNPKKRTSQLQTGNPYELYVYKTVKGYARLEKMLHAYFAKYRIRKTEWFNITFADVDNIVDQYNELQAENEQISDDEIEENDNIQERELVEETETTIITKTKVYKTTEEKYTCEKCGKEFTQGKHFQNHLNKKVSCDKKHTCVKCGKEFPSNSALSAHLNRITSCVPENSSIITKDKNKCQYCGKTYSNVYNLKRHVSACNKDKNIIYLMEKLLEKQQNAFAKQINQLQQHINNNAMKK